MALEMKVPSPGESISEVEIAEWLVEDGDYVEKDQAIAEVDSDKATLELPAEDSGIITLKAEPGDVVAVGDVVCLIDTDAPKPEGFEAAVKSAVDTFAGAMMGGGPPAFEEGAGDVVHTDQVAHLGHTLGAQKRGFLGEKLGVLGPRPVQGC